MPVLKIQCFNDFSIQCSMNNGTKKILYCLPIFNQYKHIKGVEDLFNFEKFRKAQIGKMGEIFWENTIQEKMEDPNIIKDFDISPDFILHNTVEVLFELILNNRHKLQKTILSEILHLYILGNIKITSKQIATKMALKNKYPSICNAMNLLVKKQIAIVVNDKIGAEFSLKINL